MRQRLLSVKQNLSDRLIKPLSTVIVFGPLHRDKKNGDEIIMKKPSGMGLLSFV